ncbi:hypothetical protein TWF281_007369 [Arthrobotrys megalospora]
MTTDIKNTGQTGPKDYDAASVLREGVNTFSQTVSSQRKRKRGVSSISQSSNAATSARLDSEDLKTIAGNSRLQSSLKRLVDDVDVEDHSGPKAHQKLSAPIPHATQIRSNRREAYSTTKDTLNRWLDTVKSTRSAEQLIFPLDGKTTRLNDGNHYVSHRVGQACTEQSSKLEDRVSRTLSLAKQHPGGDKSTKLSSNRARAATARLRMERELLLRNEAKAKRLKRIKSKSYRRHIKKDQQRLSRQVLPPGNANVDEMEEALRGEEDFQRDNDTPATEEDGIGLRRSINDEPLSGQRNERNFPGQRLFAMKFMAEAEKHTTIGNAIFESHEDQDSHIGRRIFHDGILVDRTRQIKAVPTKQKNGLSRSLGGSCPARPEPNQPTEASNPWLCPQPTNNNSRLETPPSASPESWTDKPQTSISIQDRNNGHTASSLTSSPFGAQGLVHSSPVLPTPDGLSTDIPHNEQPELLARAFAGDNILPEIEAERLKSPRQPGRGAPDGLQGWGSWGASLKSAGKAGKQKASQQRSNSHQTRSERVILNQKLCKKGVKYLATSLPYPFETSDQYERSLRFPLGQEWSTKQTHQTLTAPKVIVKGGTVIAPLS